MLETQAEPVLTADPLCGHLFTYRDRWGDLIKMIWWDDQGECLYSNRVERARFVWPSASEGSGRKTAAIADSLIETARLNGVDPQTWLAVVLKRIPDYKINRIDELLPCNCASTEEQEAVT